MPTEYILAYHCAPAFAGIKPSNIASCSKRENPNITVQIKMLNEKLNKNDIYIDVLCECGERVLLMVYRKQKLCEYLQRDDIKSFLCDNGYKITKETVVREGKRLYLALSAEYTEEEANFGEWYFYVGNLIYSNNSDEIEFCNRIVNRLEKKYTALINSGYDANKIGKILEEIKYEQAKRNI